MDGRKYGINWVAVGAIATVVLAVVAVMGFTVGPFAAEGSSNPAPSEVSTTAPSADGVRSTVSVVTLPPGTTEATADTSTPIPTTVRTNVEVAPTSASAALSEPQPIPPEAYVYGGGCAGGPVRIGTTDVVAPWCALGNYGDVTEKTLDINVPTGATHLTGSVMFSDGTTPAEIVGIVKVLRDAQPYADDDVTFAKPFLIDVDVHNVRRVTLRFRVADDKLQQPNIVTFVLADAMYTS